MKRAEACDRDSGPSEEKTHERTLHTKERLINGRLAPAREPNDIENERQNNTDTDNSEGKASMRITNPEDRSGFRIVQGSTGKSR